MKFSFAFAAFAATAIFDAVLCHAVRKRNFDPAKINPYDDPFYEVPVDVVEYDNGQVIDSRAITTVVQPWFTKAYQLKYRTTDGQGKATSTIATLWIPALPTRWSAKIFAYQVPEDAINLDCAPSWAWLAGSETSNGNVTRLEGALYIPWALRQGYYVIQPDAGGPNATWLVGHMEGQAALDAVRAAINFQELSTAQTKVVLYGYSGGAHSTVWAASLAKSYSSELNIVGAAYGGTPVDLISTFNFMNEKKQAILAGTALFGLAKGYPDLQTNFQNGSNGLTTEGKGLQKLFQSRKYCPSAGQGNYSYTDWNTYFKGPLLENQVLLDIAKAESLLKNVSNIGVPVPTFPRLQFHSANDQTVPYNSEAAYVNQQCEDGADIQFVSFPLADHAGSDLVAQTLVKPWITAAFNNITPRCKCGTALCI